jgi:hypothetical protein
MGVFRIIALIALLGIPSAAVAQFHAAPEMHTVAPPVVIAPPVIVQPLQVPLTVVVPPRLDSVESHCHWECNDQSNRCRNHVGACPSDCLVNICGP